MLCHLTAITKLRKGPRKLSTFTKPKTKPSTLMVKTRSSQCRGSTSFKCMADGPRKSPPDMSQKKVPMFFKFMLPGYSEKLSLPPAFLKHLMGKKCNKAILKSPLGISWHVKVCGGKACMWFGDGWFDFVLGHGLQIGECLVFRYDGDMVFYVTVFESSACEKILTVVKKDDKDHEQQRGMEDEKKQRLLPMKRKDKGKEKGNVCKSRGALGVKRFTTYKAKNPHFAARIVPSNLLIASPYLNIPAEFREANDLSTIQNMTITDPKGRSWLVKIVRLVRGKVYFSRGWSQFQAANHLQVGDVCIFEVTNTTKTAMNVRIIRRFSS